MNELKEGDGTSKPPVKVNGVLNDQMGAQRSATPSLDNEGEKERTLAQAALSVAELSMYAYVL